MIKLPFTYNEANTLGSIARMNNAERVPIRDKKLMDNIKDKSTKVMELYMSAWKSGWDDMNLEYNIAEFDFETLFEKK
jgi:hypothetical protein